MANKLNLRDKFPLKFRVVNIPEVGLTVGIKVLTGKERSDWSKTAENTREELLIRALVDEKTGERLFKDNEIEVLFDKPDWLLSQLWLMAIKINKLDPESVEQMSKLLSSPNEVGNASP